LGCSVDTSGNDGMRRCLRRVCVCMGIAYGSLISAPLTTQWPDSIDTSTGNGLFFVLVVANVISTAADLSRVRKVRTLEPGRRLL
jgi:hypothetical protein